MDQGAEATAGVGQGSRWEFAPYALLRTAGVSLEVVGALRFDRCVESIERYLALERGLLGGREALSAVLHGEVHLHREDAAVRRALIELRRELYHLRRPRRAMLERTRAVLGPAVWQQVEQCCRDLEELEGLRRGFDALLEAEQRDKRRWLRGLVRMEENFQLALGMASPSVSEHLARYLRSDSDSSHHETLEETLVTYLIRGAVKTSPLSRFAWTSVLPWPASSGQRLRVELDPASFRSEVELHRTAFRLLLDVILTHEQLGPRLRYQLHPDLQQRGEHAFLFVRERSDHITERYLRLRLSEAHRRLLEHVRMHGPISLVHLGEALGGGLSAAQALPLLRKLVDAGLLVARIAVGDDQTDALGHLAEELRQAGGPLALACAGRLEAVRKGLARQPSLGAAEHQEGRTRMQKALEEVLALLAPERPQPLPARLLYENAVASVSGCTSPPELARPELVGADQLAELLLFLQESAAPRLGDVEAFVRRYGVGGTCEDVYEFLVPGQASAQPSSAPEVELYLAPLRAACDRFQEARQTFYNELRERLQEEAQQDGGPEEVCLDPMWVRERLHPSPFARSPVASALTLVLQSVPRHQAYVLNAAFPAQGTLLSRFTPQFAAEPSGAAVLREVRAVQERLARPGRPVQLVLASNHSVNVFPRLTEEALYVPAAPPAARSEGELRLKDVVLLHDPVGHRLLWRDRAGRPLSPLDLGVLAAPFLPPISQRLARLAPRVLYRPSLIQSLESQSGPASGPVRVWPRIRMGSFILARRTWVVHGGEELQRRKGEGEMEYWLRLRQWTDAHGLPRGFFFYPHQELQRYLEVPLGQPAGQAREIRFKPQFIDLDNAFLVNSWQKLCRTIELPWHLQELLPAPEDAVASIGGHPHALELCLELLSSGEGAGHV